MSWSFLLVSLCSFTLGNAEGVLLEFSIGFLLLCTANSLEFRMHVCDISPTNPFVSWTYIIRD
ncbi:hypothetical protein JHK87_009090 [Glycine soja]|nr:hypothetical protein JHK87_009090 [Glycine soja]KAG5065492.1 hypothetical protein JHK86_009223 [Glycine max]